jgi:hypothetical protein
LPGVREVLGRVGFTFPPGSATELAQVLRALRDDPEMVETFGALALGRVAEFSWERTVAEYERLFYDLVQTRALRSALENPREERRAALHTFAQQMALNLGATRAEVLVHGAAGATLHSIASSACPEVGLRQTGSARLADDPCGDAILLGMAALAQYSYDTGEGLLLNPRPLPGASEGDKSALVVAPLSVAGQRFGTLVAQRAQPFAQGDLDSLQRLARHVAPILHSLDEVRAGTSISPTTTHYGSQAFSLPADPYASRAA